MTIFHWLRTHLICIECWHPLAGHCRHCAKPLCSYHIDIYGPHLHSPGKGLCTICRGEETLRIELYLKEHPIQFQSAICSYTTQGEQCTQEVTKHIYVKEGALMVDCCDTHAGLVMGEIATILDKRITILFRSR